MTLRFEMWLVPNSPGKERGSRWAYATAIDGHWFQIDSRMGAPNELARVLVAAGIADQPFEVWDCDRGMLAWRPRRLSAVGGRSYEEGATRPVHRVRYREPHFNAIFGGTRTKENEAAEKADPPPPVRMMRRREA